jgi:hypothetical protein
MMGHRQAALRNMTTYLTAWECDETREHEIPGFRNPIFRDSYASGQHVKEDCMTNSVLPLLLLSSSSSKAVEVDECQVICDPPPPFFFLREGSGSGIAI